MTYYVAIQRINTKVKALINEGDVDFYKNHPSVKGKYEIRKATKEEIKEAGIEDAAEPVEIKPKRGRKTEE